MPASQGGKRLLALVPNRLGAAPGQRLRIERWARYLSEHGWHIRFCPFEDEGLSRVLYRPGHYVEKTASMLRCYLRQLHAAVTSDAFDLLFVYREAALIGPAFIERLALRTNVPLLYDLDDPFFLPYRSPTNGYLSRLKCPDKVRTLCRLSHKALAISTPIAAYMQRYTPSVEVVPMAVDTAHFRPGSGSGCTIPRLVWIGSHSTMRNLLAIEAPLRSLAQTNPYSLRVIGSGTLAIEGLPIDYRNWSELTEVHDLETCDIGLVPVPDHPWSPYKMFFKTIQLMAMGLPVVASRIGANCEIIEHGVNGFLAGTAREWEDSLRALLGNEHLRTQMGRAARKTVVERFALDRQLPQVAAIFNACLASRA